MRQIIVGISAVFLAAFLDLTDNTSVSVAFPSIAGSLGASHAVLQWVSIGNTLALGAGLALGGQLGDQYGRRKMFLIGVAGYIVTTVLCAVAPTGMALAIFRFIQGLVGSLMIPQIFGIIKASVPEAKQPAVFGMYGIVLSLAAIAGPLLGGVLVSWNAFHLSWRLVFFFNVPIAVVAFVLGYLYIPESLASVRQGINVLGAIVVAVATTLVLLPLSLMSTSGWPAWGFPALVLAAALYAFLYVSGMRKFRDQNVHLRQFSLGMAASLLFFSVVGALFIILSLYVAQTSQRSAWGIALVMLPYAVGSVLTSGVSTAAEARHGRALCVLGAALSAGFTAAFAGLLHINPQPAYWQYAVVLLIGGMGVGLCAPILINLILSAVPHDLAGSASGLLNTCSQIGAAAGIAVFMTWYFDGTDSSSFISALIGMTVVYALSAVLSALLPKASQA
ncbi:MFS transporter [Corynebacterium matruchotii]|uniref:MFS transporter n=1 Tax=Corynebacterium matruchotii TaxID=43768 RepID=UPI0028EAA4EC|nr:MFS transporter [Corynebacterium matruchotii]